jgi:hypothetical protein
MIIERLLGFVLGCVVLVPLPAASAVVLFDQGNPSPTNGASVGSFGVADDFELSFDARLESVTFWALEGVGASWNGRLQYDLWADVPSGIGNPNEGSRPAATPFRTGMIDKSNPAHVISRTATGNIVNIPGDINSPRTQYEYSFDLLSTVGLTKNTRYWLSLNLGGTGSILWQDNAIDWGRWVWMGDTSAPPVTWFAGSETENRVSVAFQLEGTQIPTPTTLLLAAGGLGALGLAHRRKRRHG